MKTGMAIRPHNPRDPFGGYAPTTIILHWTAAVFVIALYVVHGRNASTHIGLGLIAAPFLLWRVTRRFKRGFARISDLSAAFNVTSRVTMFALLVCVLALAVTGLLLPMLRGDAYLVFDWTSFTMPFPIMPEAAMIAETIHSIAGHSCMLLAGFHIIDGLTHHFFDKDNVLVRILRPAKNGK